jgi:uncharacterized membrane protein
MEENTMALTQPNKTSSTSSQITDNGNDSPWTRVNVGTTERSLSAFTGAALTIYGLLRRGRINPGLTLLAGEALYRGLTGHSFLYQALGINTVENDPTVSNIPGMGGIRIHRSMTINRPADDLFAFWSNFEQAPQYMGSIASVTKTDERTAHWSAKGPGGNTVEWDTEITQLNPPSLIAWQVRGTPIQTVARAGKITFVPATNGRGTIATLELDFLQGIGSIVSRLGKISTLLPETVTRETLRRFKELMEAGELPTISGQPVGEGQPLSKQGKKL